MPTDPITSFLASAIKTITRKGNLLTPLLQMMMLASFVCLYLFRETRNVLFLIPLATLLVVGVIVYICLLIFNENGLRSEEVTIERMRIDSQMGDAKNIISPADYEQLPAVNASDKSIISLESKTIAAPKVKVKKS